MGNVHSQVTKTAMSLTNHSQQAANTTDTGSPLPDALWNSRAENHGLLKPATASKSCHTQTHSFILLVRFKREID